MRNKKIMLFRNVLTLFLCGISFLMFGQNNAQKQFQNVFDQLVLAYGSAKPAPQLNIILNKPKQIAPAKYYSSPKPNIKVDAYLLTICRTFGKDSLSALSVVLSHELAHYYSDHTFCSDYAYAIKDKNQSLVPALKNATLNEKISKETEADQKGFFYAAAAGFSPFNLQGNLIDKIYKEYDLQDKQPGYPTKNERIIIAKNAEEKATELYNYFKVGLKALEEKKYDDAITAFETANSFIPYRENYNNIGVAKIRKALLLKVKTSEEYKFPDRFLYPLEVENKRNVASSPRNLASTSIFVLQGKGVIFYLAFPKPSRSTLQHHTWRSEGRSNLGLRTTNHLFPNRIDAIGCPLREIFE